jgi:CheY-like chemotaxis protein
MSGARILLVEDEWLILDVTAAELAEAGFDVLTASDGEEALALLQGGAEVDLLFTDIRMPGRLDGWALAQSARALRPGLPVAYATGFARDAPEKVEGALFFDKPYRTSDVIAALGGLLARSARTG